MKGNIKTMQVLSWRNKTLHKPDKNCWYWFPCPCPFLKVQNLLVCENLVQEDNSLKLPLGAAKLQSGEQGGLLDPPLYCLSDSSGVRWGWTWKSAQALDTAHTKRGSRDRISFCIWQNRAQHDTGNCTQCGQNNKNKQLVQNQHCFKPRGDPRLGSGFTSATW